MDFLSVLIWPEYLKFHVYYLCLEFDIAIEVCSQVFEMNMKTEEGYTSFHKHWLFKKVPKKLSLTS